jgi:hypothetical protein
MMIAECSDFVPERIIKDMFLSLPMVCPPICVTVGNVITPPRRRRYQALELASPKRVFSTLPNLVELSSSS